MDYQDYTDIFKALADNNRIKILSVIHSKKEACACDIIKYFEITQPTFSYHMKLLQDADLVLCRKERTFCYYQINYDKIEQIKKYLTTFKI